jgi:hypothetical protein
MQIELNHREPCQCQSEIILAHYIGPRPIEYVDPRMFGQMTVGDGRTLMVAGYQIDGRALIGYLFNPSSTKLWSKSVKIAVARL